jgi:hypothetical protein
MSGWIDIRVRKPTATDANQNNYVQWLLANKNVCFLPWDWDFYCEPPIAWMPIPEFKPLPDPPEGFRYVQEQEPFDKRARFWSDLLKKWEITTNTAYDPRLTYIAPIDPPAPTYRPFADAAEFLPHSHRPLRSTKSGRNHHIRVDIFNDDYWSLSGEYSNEHSYAVMLDEYVFGDDGKPCGVKVEA